MFFKMRNKRAIERLQKQGLSEMEISEIVSMMATCKLPIEKITQEQSAEVILKTCRKMKEVLK